MTPPTSSDPTRAVRLRDVTKEDLPFLFDHQSDPEATRMAAFPMRERGAFMTHWARILRDRSLVKKTILLDGQVAGNVVSFERLGVREVGYWIGRAYWGQGIATRALSLLLREYTRRPLYARVAVHNVASIRVLQKCGFAPCNEDLGSAAAPGDDIEEILLKLEA